MDCSIGENFTDALGILDDHEQVLQAWGKAATTRRLIDGGFPPGLVLTIHTYVFTQSDTVKKLLRGTPGFLEWQEAKRRGREPFLRLEVVPEKTGGYPGKIRTAHRCAGKGKLDGKFFLEAEERCQLVRSLARWVVPGGGIGDNASFEDGCDRNMTRWIDMQFNYQIDHTGHSVIPSPVWHGVLLPFSPRDGRILAVDEVGNLLLCVRPLMTNDFCDDHEHFYVPLRLLGPSVQPNNGKQEQCSLVHSVVSSLWTLIKIRTLTQSLDLQPEYPSSEEEDYQAELEALEAAGTLSMAQACEAVRDW